MPIKMETVPQTRDRDCLCKTLRYPIPHCKWCGGTGKLSIEAKMALDNWLRTLSADVVPEAGSGGPK